MWDPTWLETLRLLMSSLMMRTSGRTSWAVSGSVDAEVYLLRDQVTGTRYLQTAITAWGVEFRASALSSP